jgi:signal peptidase I
VVVSHKSNVGAFHILPPRYLFALLLIAVALATGARTLVVVKVRGLSMRPTLNDGDRVVALRVPGLLLRRGDIVVVRAPNVPLLANTPGASGVLSGGSGWIVKRVAATSGTWLLPPIVDLPVFVPSRHAFLVGDGPNSIDSRVFGPVPYSQIRGLVILPRYSRQPGPIIPNIGALPIVHDE